MAYCLQNKNNAFQILGDLKQKRGVTFVLDQFMGMPYGVESRFFGVTTGTAYGLALFAKKTCKPVYPLYTYWSNTGKHGPAQLVQTRGVCEHASRREPGLDNRFSLLAPIEVPKPTRERPKKARWCVLNQPL